MWRSAQCPPPMRGEVIAFHLFDLGGTLDLGALEARLEPRGPTRAPPVGKGTPPYVEFPQPLVVGLPPLELATPIGPLRAEATLYYFAIGAVSLRIRVPLEFAGLKALGGWRQATATLDGRALGLDGAARHLVERERAQWQACLRDVYTRHVLHESYTVFALTEVGEPPEAFLDRHGREIAGVLSGEPGDRLHEKEVKEALRRSFSYYADDLIVIDWDAAFIVDPNPEYEDILFVLEIANLQLLEFRAYDLYLDEAIGRAYDDLERLFRSSGLFRNARRTVHELSLVRIEVAELADKADNITKFLGDWFLARIYQAAQEEFHLAAWRATVDEKLETINGLYRLANAESDNRRLITLELLIVLLFVVDLLLLVFR